MTQTETITEQIDSLEERIRKIEWKVEKIRNANQDLKIEVKVLEEYILQDRALAK